MSEYRLTRRGRVVVDALGALACTAIIVAFIAEMCLVLAAWFGVI